MAIFYSATTKGFYDDSIHDVIPNDGVQITNDEYNKLFEGQNNGLEIAPDENGFPINVERPLPSKDLIEQARALAYQRESDPIFMQYQRGEATEQEWLDAVQAVKDANPYPVKEAK